MTRASTAPPPSSAIVCPRSGSPTPRPGSRGRTRRPIGPASSKPSTGCSARSLARSRVASASACSFATPRPSARPRRRSRAPASISQRSSSTPSRPTAPGCATRSRPSSFAPRSLEAPRKRRRARLRRVGGPRKVAEPKPVGKSQRSSGASTVGLATRTTSTTTRSATKSRHFVSYPCSSPWSPSGRSRTASCSKAAPSTSTARGRSSRRNSACSRAIRRGTPSSAAP